MSDRRLLMTTRSPFARKARIALLEKNLSFEDVPVDLGKKSVELLQTGPLQKVPVLFDQGLTVVDSSVICEYLEERYPANPLYPHGYLHRADARMWDAAAATLSESAIKIFMDKAKPAAQHDADGTAKADALIARICDYAEATVRDRAFLIAGTFTIADIALVSALGYAEFRLGPAWKTARPNLVRYFEEHSLRDSVRKTFPVA